jgi:hypothetical protein
MLAQHASNVFEWVEFPSSAPAMNKKSETALRRLLRASGRLKKAELALARAQQSYWGLYVKYPMERVVLMRSAA